MPITVLLADDHPIFRKGLSYLLAEEADFEVVGEAEDGRKAIEMAISTAPDVAVMDISMPDVDGIEATRQIRSEVPNTKILTLSIHGEKRFVEDMLRAGAVGYMLKESAPEELVAGIRAVQRGEIYLSPAITDVAVEQYRTLLTEGIPLESTHLAMNSILVSKLNRPQVAPSTLSRSRLLAYLDGWRQRALTLVSAPAGYGKSTLVIQWLAARTHISAWISLDEDDNDLAIFLTYWVEAVERLFPDSLPGERVPAGSEPVAAAERAGHNPGQRNGSDRGRFCLGPGRLPPDRHPGHPCTAA
jgi:DNA-binding NarL/FixJ family response regulator